MRPSSLLVILIALVLMFVPFIAYHGYYGTGWFTAARRSIYPITCQITASRPTDGETDIPPNAFIAADIQIPGNGRGLDRKTLTSENIRLWRTRDRKQVPAYINTSGAGDAIVLQPINALDAHTTYTFEVTRGVTDQRDHPFDRYVANFTTSAGLATVEFPAAFEKVDLKLDSHTFIGVTIGPDNRLYAGAIDGYIFRWDIRPDGTLTDEQRIETLQHQGTKRLVIGLRFDPASTKDNLVMWVSHGTLVGDVLIDQPDWGSKVSRLSGVNLEKIEDVLINLPRATKDHVTNQMDFGPDGCLYFTQGSNSAMGAPDPIWGNRPEHLLSAAMLRLDVKRLGKLPIDCKTKDGGPYDPAAPNAPLTIYATGLREAFDTLWHTNGKLYTGINGSAAGGNAPATPSGYKGQSVPALFDIKQTQMDFVSSVEKGKYYGHPNPTRGEYVMFGGNPTGNKDLQEIPFYPVGTNPDKNWKCPDFIIGRNLSPNGLIEYKGDFFGGALKGKLMIVRYSGGKDVVTIGLDSSGNLTEYITGIDGFNQFNSPLDLVQDLRNGCVYVTEFAGRKITLLRPIANGVSKSVIRQQISSETHEAIR